MCGITAFFSRESRIDLKHLDTLFTACETRGQDGFGFLTIKNSPQGRSIGYCFKDHRPYHEIRDLVLQMIQEQNLSIGSVIIGIARAAPETEGNTNKDRIDETMQPIINKYHNIAVVHNGAVSGKIYNELRDWAATSGEYKFTTDIDSEAILASYIKHQRNMKDAFEYLSGGFACIVYDQMMDMLYVVNDHMQIAHGYIKGLGFFLCSELDALRKVILDVTGCRKDGVNIWECYYAHYLDGGAIRQIDLQSGFMRKINYTPRYIVGSTFDTKKE